MYFDLDFDLYHVNDSTSYVGGGSLGAHKMTFNSAEAGRDSVHNIRTEVSPDHRASTLLKQMLYLQRSTSPLSLRDCTLVKDSHLVVGQLTTRDWTIEDVTWFCFVALFDYDLFVYFRPSKSLEHCTSLCISEPFEGLMDSCLTTSFGF